MSASIHSLDHGSSLLLPISGEFGSPQFSMVIGGGGGCALKIIGPVAGVWVPLRGRLQLSGDDLNATLHLGDYCVTEIQPSIRAVGRGNALWLAFLGSPPAWRAALAGASDQFVSDPPLLPAIGLADRKLRHRAIQLARAASRGDLDAAVDAIADGVCSMQSKFDATISRCPGRSDAQRRQVFLRLQRVRNYLVTNCHLELDNDTLARMASYSSWNFIRAFSAAYQETPHSYLVTQRLLRAHRLLRSTVLAVGEVALACGFENPCAFSRLFHKRFGTTASTLRHQNTTTVPGKNDRRGSPIFDLTSAFVPKLELSGKTGRQHSDWSR